MQLVTPRVNSAIPLATQSPDIPNALAQGTRAAAMQNDLMQQNALRGVYQEHGPGIVAGDQNALNALAQFDPGQAMGIRQAHNAEARADERLRLARAQGARAAQGIKDAQDRAAREAEVRQELEGIQRLARIAEVGSDEEFFTASSMILGQGITKDQFPLVVATAQGVSEELWRDVSPQAPAPDFESEQKLRKEFLGLPQVKAFSEQSQGYQRVVASAQRGMDTDSPAADLALVFNFMKVQDPGSVVRESEFATAESAARWLQEAGESGVAVPLPVARAIRRLQSGERLSEEQRRDFVATAQQVYAMSEQGFNTLRSQYEGLAQQYNMDPSRSFIDFSTDAELRDGPPDPAGSSGSQPSVQILSDRERDLLGKYGSGTSP